MKNKSFLKMMGRSIKGSLSRFVAIVGITALGAGFLAGLMATSPDMKESSNEFFESLNLYDYYVQSTLGFSEENIKEIKNEPYIKDVMAIEQYDKFVKDDQGESLESRIYHVDFQDKNMLNKVELLEGEMPKNSKECVVEVPNKYNYKAKIGGHYVDEDGDKYKVTGIVRSPLFISFNGEPTTIGKGSIAIAMFVPEKEKPEVYTAVYAISNVKNRDTFSEEYETDLKKYQKDLEAFGKVQVKERRQDIVDEASKELNDNKRKFNREKKDALDKIRKGERELQTNEQKLKDGKKEIETGLTQIDNGLSQIENGKGQILDGKKQIRNGLKEINGGIGLIDNGLEQLEPGIAQLKGAISQLEGQLSMVPEDQQGPILAQIEALKNQLAPLEEKQGQLKEQKRELLAKKQGLEEQLGGLEAQERTLENKKAGLLATRGEIIEKRGELAEGQRELEKGKAELAESKAKANREFSKAEKKIKDAEKEIRDIEQGEWFVANRLDATGVNSYVSDVDKIRAIANIFPVFFFAVAALVVLTTMTRMIEEERGQVGTLKSLGYGNRLLRRYYLFYGAVATVVGSVSGLVAGFLVLPKVIANAYAMMYNLPETATPFRWPLAIYIMVITVIFVIVTILFACRKELKEKPAMLLQPKAPEAGKRILLERITPIWNRLKFTRKITLRNLFRYKKRFLMTIIGVAGCFALLLTGFGIRDSIGDIVQLQFGEVTKYDVNVALDEDSWKAKQDIFSEEGRFATETVTMKNGKLEDLVTLTVPRSEKELETFVDLRVRGSKTPMKLHNGEMLLSEKLTEICDLKKGDQVTITQEGKKDVTMKVAGFFENYVGNVAYITPDTYKDLYGVNPKYNSVYLNIRDKDKNTDIDSIITDLMDDKGVNFAIATDTIRKTFDDSVKNIDYIVGVLIICAGLLSIIVLYNLTNINICERKKELATIKVLGFYNHEVRGYIFREVYMLSFIGILVGIPCGLMLHRFVIRTAEVGGMMFGRNIYWYSFLLAILITLGFTMLVSFIMRRSINKINMVESMKATD